MARDDKRAEKAEKADDYEFVPPDFDEDAFIHKELVSFRTTAVLFVWGIIAALVSWILFGPVGGAKTGWFVGLAIFIAFGLALKFVYARLKIDVKHVARREWTGTWFLLFFTWLAFFLLLVNPPISDYSAPEVEIFVSPPAQAAGAPVVIDLFVEDNVRVTDFTFTLERGSDVMASRDALEDLGHGHYRLTQDGLGTGSYGVFASAEDRKGHEGVGETTFDVGDQALILTLPDGDVMNGPTDVVFVEVPGVDACKTRKGVATGGYPCLRTVRLDLDNGGEVPLKFEDDLGGWQAGPTYAGWQMGNNNFTVTAELVDRYHGTQRIPGGDLVLTQWATVDLQWDAAGEPFEVKVPRDPGTPTRSTPGAGVALVALGIVGLTMVVRARRDP